MDFVYRKDVGLNYVWLSNVVNDVNWLCKEVQARLQMQYVQEWHTTVFDSSKCSYYRIFKTEFKTEFYLTKLQPNFYIPIARFRTANHRLSIERGRLDDISRRLRVCTSYEIKPPST